MIPYALKLVWFCFSLAGTNMNRSCVIINHINFFPFLGVFVCWYAFIILPGRNFGGLWGRLWYCIVLTWLEIAFCLGDFELLLIIHLFVLSDF